MFRATRHLLKRVKPRNTRGFSDHPTSNGTDDFAKYWLTPFAVLYAIGFVYFFGICDQPGSLNNWAREEALARRAARSRGEEVVFGKFLTAVPDLSNDDFEVYDDEGNVIEN